MLKDIANIMQVGDTVSLILTAEADHQFRLNILPRLGKQPDKDDDDDDDEKSPRKALRQPLTMSGTIDELLSPEAAAALAQFTNKVTGLRTNLDEADAEIKQAEETAQAEREKKKSTGKPAPKPTHKPVAKPVAKAPVKPVATPARPTPGKSIPSAPTAPAAAPVGFRVAEAPEENETEQPEANEAEVAEAAEATPPPAPPVVKPTALTKTKPLF